MTKVVINNGKCVGCGLCAQECPLNFEMNDEGIAVYKKQESECNMVVVTEMCPTEAMEIKDE